MSVRALTEEAREGDVATEQANAAGEEEAKDSVVRDAEEGNSVAGKSAAEQKPKSGAPPQPKKENSFKDRAPALKTLLIPKDVYVE